MFCDPVRCGHSGYDINCPIKYVLRGRVLDDERSQFVRQVSARDGTTGLAEQVNLTLGRDLDYGLRVLILLAQHELLNETVQELLKILLICRIQAVLNFAGDR